MRVFTHGPERRLLRTSGLFKKSLSIICFAGQKSLMFHEAYHVTIKTSRFVTLLQAVEESADWVLFIGAASKDTVSLQTSVISFRFVLREVLYQIKYCSQ